jgi:PAS domain S-box-containing protein
MMENLLILHPYTLLFSSVITVCLSIYAYARNPEDRLTRYFSMFVFAFGFGGLLDGSYRLVPFEYIWLVKFFNTLSVSILVFGTGFFLLFAWVYIRKSRPITNPFIYIASFIPAAVISYFFLFTEYPNHGYAPSIYGNVANVDPIFYKVMAVYLALFGLFGGGIILYSAIVEGSPILRKRGIIIFAASMMPTIIGILTNVFLPSLGMKLPSQLANSLALFCLITFYAMRRYSLFTIVPKQAVDAILQNTYSSIVALDIEAKVSFANPSACKLLRLEEEELKDKKLSRFFEKKANELIQIDLLDKDKPIKEYETKIMVSSGEERWIKINGVILNDPSGAKIGALLDFEDITESRESEIKIKKHAAELEKINKFMEGRELEMVELKKKIESLKGEVNQLLKESGRAGKY